MPRALSGVLGNQRSGFRIHASSSDRFNVAVLVVEVEQPAGEHAAGHEVGEVRRVAASSGRGLDVDHDLVALGVLRPLIWWHWGSAR